MTNSAIGMDPLTNVMSRENGFAHLSQHIDNAKINNTKVAVLYIDLDNFKPFNVHNGYMKGDLILKNYSSLITPIFQPRYEVFRIGGDEFVIIIPNMADGEAEALAEAICDISRKQLTPPQPVHCGDPHCVGPATLSVSIGIATSLPDDDVKSLLNKAEEKLYAAKTGGRDCFCA
ncbi:MAG: GGDEF domain-containing protein [Pseudomonadota bacterium]